MGVRYASQTEARRRSIIERVSEHRRKRKRQAIEYKGGECRVCGYDRCAGALCFHHLDPDEKDFMLNRVFARAWSYIRKELDKCILVCSNCHAEIHDGLVDLRLILTDEEIERAKAAANEPPLILRFFGKQ